MTKAASAAQEAGTELGGGEFGQALKRTWRPSEDTRRSFEDIHQFHTDQAKTLGDAVETSYGHYRPRFAEALTGAAGDALLAAHDATVNTWSDHQDKHAAAATAASQALVHITGLQTRIDNLAEAGEEEFNTAIRNRDPLAAMEVWTRYNGHAEESTSEATKKATSAIQAANFTIPLDTPKAPEDGNRSESSEQDKKSSDRKRTDPDATRATHDGTDADGGKKGNETNPLNANRTDGPPTPADTSANAANAGRTDPNLGQQTPPPTMLSQLPQAMGGASASGGGQGGGAGGGGMSGLGSAFKPPSSMGSSSSMPTSPASSMPSVPSAPSTSSAASPMSNPGSSFQSGLASGMSAAGGGSSFAPSPVSQQMPQQALAAHQVATGTPAFGSGPAAGVPLSAPGGDAGGGGASSGPAGGGGAPAGGSTPMMPPAAAMGGGAPLAPYSAPGAGASGGSAGGGAATAPATTSGQSASAGSGMAAPGPLVAGGAGSTVSAPGVAAMGAEVNPDLLLAQRVLAGLIRGCERYPTWVRWAVSVLKMPMGSQVVIASNIGDGGYVPPGVFIPATARLAVADPVLPFGWGQRWMGGQHPAKALVDHFEHVRKRVAGVSLSALVTNEIWAETPVGVDDFLAVNHVDAMNMLAQAPVLDGGHQHRLTALDPVLAQRLSSLVEAGYAPAWVSGQLTVAVIGAAQQQEEIAGCKLVTDDELNVLASVNRGSANDMTWKLYDQLADKRHDQALMYPETHGVEDVDGSDVNKAIATLYQRYYQAARIVEMVRWWKYDPPPVMEIAYCGIQAGFGSVVAAVVSTLEMNARRQGGAA
ncbi:hypothetical protein [Mycolicibacterium aromaticivorans]|nr:hypothetical protein [Mycolicibacterium aromaticivorans]